MARSSAAVARASDSRCAATWPLALARRWRSAGGSGPLLAASRELGRRRSRGRDAARRRADRCRPDRAHAARCRARRAASRRRRGVLRAPASGWREPRAPPSALHLGEELLGVGDQLVGDRFGVDLERAVGELGGDPGDLVGIELARGAAREQGRRGAREGDRRAGIDVARRRVAARRRSPWRRRPPARLACRRPGPAAACQRVVRSSWGSPGGAGGAGTFIMDGLSARPVTTLEISATTPRSRGVPLTASAPGGARRWATPVTTRPLSVRTLAGWPSMPLVSAWPTPSSAKPSPAATTLTVSPAANHWRDLMCAWRTRLARAKRPGRGCGRRPASCRRRPA